jgi:hypothetical protein
MDNIEQCKREHWTEFLDSRDNIRKACVYTKTRRASQCIPVSKVGDTEVTDDREKADLLLNSFFPVPPQPVNQDST